MSVPLFPWDNSNTQPVAPVGAPASQPLKLGAPIGASTNALSTAANGPPPFPSAARPAAAVNNGAASARAGPNAGPSSSHQAMRQQQQQQQQAQSSAATGALVPTAPSTHAMMGPYGSSSNVGMMGGMGYGGGMYGGGMNSMYGAGAGMGMMGGSMGMGMGALGMHNGASTMMPANAAAAAVGPDGRPIAPVAKLQGWAIFAELASRLVQVIMHMARSGHEVFSVVAGSYWAFTSIRAMLGLGGPAPMHPMLQQQQGALVAKAGAAAGVAGAAKVNGLTNVTTPAVVNGAPTPSAAAPSSGRRTALFFGLFMVVATMVEFLYRRHQEKKKQQELEALRRQHQRLLTNTASGAAVDATATSDSSTANSSLPSTRCVAIHDFAGEGDGQMAFRCGDQLEVKEFDPKGWCFAASTGIAREDRVVGAEDDGAATRARATTLASGWVPGNFLRPLIQHRKL